MAAPKSRLYTIIAIGVFAVLSIAVVLTAVTFTRNNVTSRSIFSNGEQRDKRSCQLTANKLREVLEKICESRVDLLLNVSYNGEQFTCGQPSVIEETAVMPNVKLKHADKNAQYTIMMLDPNAPGHSLENLKFYLHWAKVNAFVSNGPTQHQDTKSDPTTLMSYMGPSPPKGSGVHKYKIIVFESTEQNDIKLHHDATNRKNFMLNDFVRKNGLCNIVGLFEFAVGVDK